MHWKLLIMALLLIPVCVGEVTYTSRYSTRVCEQGSCTSHYGSAPVSYVKDGEFVAINTSYGTEGCDFGYDFCILENEFNVHVKSEPDVAEVVKYVVNGSAFIFQPFTLNYRNDLSQLQQVNTVQYAPVSVNGSLAKYDDIFEYGTSLEYSITGRMLKEHLVLSNPLPTPAQYIIDGGNPTLDMDFLINYDSDLSLYVDDVLWDKSSTLTTSGRVDFRKDNSTLFYLPPVISYDSNGSTSEGSYEFKKGGSKLYVVIKTNYSWLQNATYPVWIDPGISYNFATNQSLGYVGYDIDATPFPPNNVYINLGAGTETDSTTSATYDYSDNSRASRTASAGKYVYEHFIFTLAESKSDIVQINFTMEADTLYSGAVMYAWNFTDNSWESCATIGTSEVFRTCTFYPEDVVNTSGQTNFLLYADATFEAISVDFFSVNLSTVQNVAPDDVTPALNTSDDTNFSTRDLNCTFTPTDSDGDPLTGNVTWYNDGVLNFTVSGISLTDGTPHVETLTYPNTTFHESWICQVDFCDDSGLCNNPSNSTPLNVTPAAYYIDIISPNSTDPLSVSAGDNITVLFYFLVDLINITNGISIQNVSIGGFDAQIVNTSTCSGTLDCSQYSTEASCENCSQCDWNAAVAAANYNATIDNLGAYMRFPLSSNAVDVYGNQGSIIDTVVGSATPVPWSIPNPPSVNWLYFDGNDGWDSSGDNTNVNTYTNPAGDWFAMSVWFNASTINDSNNGEIIWSQGGGTNSLTVYVTDDLGYDAVFCTAVESANIDYVYAPIEPNHIYHLGCIYDFAGGNITMWVNGTEIMSDTSLSIGTDLAAHSGDVALANSDTDTVDHDGLAIGGFWHGNLGDLVFWGVAQDDLVSGVNFTTIYNNGMTGEVAANCGATGGGACSSCEVNQCESNCSDAGCALSGLNQLAWNVDGWHLNITVPDQGLTSTQDIYINATFEIYHANGTEEDAVSFSGATCDCPAEGSNFEINDGSDCTLSTACDIGSGIFRLNSGSFRIASGGYLRAAGCFAAYDQPFFVPYDGGLRCGT